MNELQAKKILLVEDETAIALPLGDKLAQAGYAVLKASDGEAGLAIALQEHPDLILADLRMSKMTGLEMIAELRHDPWGATVKVLILTNVSDVASLEEAVRYSTLHYLVKSDNTLEGVLEKIHTLLGDKH